MPDLTKSEEIVRVLNYHMKRKGVSRAELARRVGLHKTTVSNFFNRKRVDASFNLVVKMFDAIDMKIGVVDK